MTNQLERTRQLFEACCYVFHLYHSAEIDEDKRDLQTAFVALRAVSYRRMDQGDHASTTTE